MQSKAATVAEYLAELSEERRREIEAVRKVLLASLDKEIEEGMLYGMIGYYIPHRVYPAGYHCDPKQPLGFCCLAAQKNYNALYLGIVYGHTPTAEKFKQGWAKTGKKLDMGKSCIRFKKADDLALDVIANAVKSVTAKKFIDYYEANIKDSRKRGGKTEGKAKAAKATPGTSVPAKAKRTSKVGGRASKKASK